MADVVLANVSKVYDGGVEAVCGLDLRVADGELMVLVGPSGSGKSTVLRLVAGLEDLSGGEIRIGGRLANGMPPRDRDVAMVFQDFALYPHMTVARNIGFALQLRRVSRDEVRARVMKVAAMLGIDELLERRPHTLSGGQQQRVALARAIVREPAVFLFDEPLSNLDARLRVSTRGEIKALQKRLGTTALYVTHDQEEAMSLGDRVAVICQGRLQQVGTPRDVYDHPANRFVGSFIGSPPMNLFEGRVEPDGDGFVFVEDGGGANRVTLPRRWRTSMEAKATGALVLGVRPLGLSVSGRDDGWKVTIDHVEELGETVDLIGSTAGGQPFSVRLPAGTDAPAPGPARLEFDMTRAFPFEPGPFGRNLLAENEGE